MGASAPHSPHEPWKSTCCEKKYQTKEIKGNRISVLQLFTFNMVLWVAGPSFVD